MNGELRQNGDPRAMSLDYSVLIQHLSADTMLWPGDLIANGTPTADSIGS